MNKSLSPEALDELTDEVLNRPGGELHINNLLNDVRHGNISKWDLVREVLRLADEAVQPVAG